MCEVFTARALRRGALPPFPTQQLAQRDDDPSNDKDQKNENEYRNGEREVRVRPDKDPDACDRAELRHVRNSVRHRLGRAVDGVTQAELRSMRRESQTAAEQSRSDEK